MPELRALTARHQNALYVASLALLVTVLGVHTLDGFWRGDDTAVLAHMLKHPLLDIFFVPSAYQELSAANLTPWVSLSFYVDYTLAGLNPRVFYLHHMVSLWLVAVVVMRLLTLFVARWLAWFGALLFLLGTPVLRVGEQLFTRHYLEGLLLCLLALYFFLLHQRDSKPRDLLVSALCYALAMSAKEVYVPLGVLLVCLAVAKGERSQRIRQAAPYLVLMGLYMLWRGYMLSGNVGGYSQASTYVELAFWRNVTTTFFGIPALLFGAFTVFVALPLFGVIAAGFLREPRRLPWAVLVTGLILAPLVPLVAYPGITGADRYLLLPWFLLCFGFAVQAQVLLRLARNGRSGAWLNAGAATVCLVMASLLLVHYTRTRQVDASAFAVVDVQMRHVWNSDASTAFAPDADIAASFWMVRTLGEIKQLLDPSASIPKLVTDTIFLDASLPLYAYSGECRCMQDVSATIPERLAQFSQARRAADLSLTISNDDGWLVWSFGPYATGSYNVVSDFIGNVQLPASQPGLRTNIRRNVDFYLRYTAPEGWVTYSPLLHLTPDGEVLTWSRE